jgi:hypothetical protein
MICVILPKMFESIGEEGGNLLEITRRTTKMNRKLRNKGDKY